MNLEYIHKSLRDKLEWDVECLALDLFDEPGFSSCTKLPTQHDLTNFLPAEINSYYNQGGGVSTDERLWFPLELSDAPSICRVINDVSCFKGGYELVCGIKKKCKTYTKTTLRCQCGNRAKHSVGTKKATKSTKPQDDKPICGMYINIFQDIENHQYYIRKNGGHNLHHSGHPPVQKELKPAMKRHLKESAVDKIHEMIKKNVNATVIQEMIDYEYGTKLNMSSIKKMRQAVLMEEFNITTDTDQTTAQILLEWLEGQPDVDYVAYYGSYENAEDTVKVRKERKKGKRTKVATRTNSKGLDVKPPSVQQTNKSNIPLAEDPDILNDVSQEAKSFVKNLITQLTTGDGTILLAVMWITDDGKLYHKKFPHVLGCDVTFGTNAEKRPLFRASGKTTDNKNIPHINAFVPSQQRWVFDWIFEDGLPSILDEEDLKKTCIILTDQDAQLVGALLTRLNLKGNSKYGIALNRLCKWHKISIDVVCMFLLYPSYQSSSHHDSIILPHIDRNYDMGARIHIKTDLDSQFVTTIIHWLYHFTNDIETEAQMKDSYEKLTSFVIAGEKDPNLTKSLLNYTDTFLRESFHPLLPLLCQCYFQDVFCGDVNANCFVESDNASLKKDPMKPNANSKLYVSCKNICDHTNRRIIKLKTNAAKNVRSQLLAKQTDDDVDKLRRELSKHIVLDKREKVLSQFIASPDYTFCIQEETDMSITCLVRKFNVTPPSLEEKGPIPVYHLTRSVTISQHMVSYGNTRNICVILRCSCNFHKRVKGPCRHIYCILDESPIPQHFGLELFTEYEAYYGEDILYTARVDEFTKEIDRLGGGILLHMSLMEFKNEKMRCVATDDFSMDWFFETLNDVGKDVNIFQHASMNMDEALIKDGGSGGKRSLGTHSKHGRNKRSNATVGNALAMMADRKNQNAYSRAYPNFAEAADACTSEDDIQKLVDVLNEFRFATIQKNSRAVGRHLALGSVEEIISLPEQETKKHVPRKKPMCSPSRHNKK